MCRAQKRVNAPRFAGVDSTRNVDSRVPKIWRLDKPPAPHKKVEQSTGCGVRTSIDRDLTVLKQAGTTRRSPTNGPFCANNACLPMRSNGLRCARKRITAHSFAANLPSTRRRRRPTKVGGSRGDAYSTNIYANEHKQLGRKKEQHAALLSLLERAPLRDLLLDTLSEQSRTPPPRAAPGRSSRG